MRNYWAILLLSSVTACSPLTYEKAVQRWEHEVLKAMDRPCVPRGVYDAFNDLARIAEQDSLLWQEFVATTEQELLSLEQTCGYLRES